MTLPLEGTVVVQLASHSPQSKPVFCITVSNIRFTNLNQHRKKYVEPKNLGPEPSGRDFEKKEDWEHWVHFERHKYIEYEYRHLFKKQIELTNNQISADISRVNLLLLGNPRKIKQLQFRNIPGTCLNSPFYMNTSASYGC